MGRTVCAQYAELPYLQGRGVFVIPSLSAVIRAGVLCTVYQGRCVVHCVPGPAALLLTCGGLETEPTDQAIHNRQSVQL